MVGFSLNVPCPDYEQHFHWRHPELKICVTMSYHKDTRKFLGINTFGIRMRHEVFDRWLTKERDIDYVVAHLKEANFDPEFFKNYENEILNSFKEQLVEV